MPKKAITEEPDWMDTQTEPGHDSFIFTEYQKITYPSAHLKECGWYIECAKTFCPAEEEDLKRRLGAINATPEEVPDVEEAAPEDPKVGQRRKKAQAQLGRRVAQRTTASQDGGTGSVAGSPVDNRKGQRSPKSPKSRRRLDGPSPSGNSSGTDFTLSQPEFRLVDEPKEVEYDTFDLIMNGMINKSMFDAVYKFASQCNYGKSCRVYGRNQTKDGMVDLVVAQVPDNSPVPGISRTASDVPKWNVLHKDWFKNTFVFAHTFLHDDGALVFVYTDDNSTRKTIRSFCPSLGFKMFKEWTGFNILPLRVPSRVETTNLFRVGLYVRCTPDPRAASLPTGTRNSAFTLKPTHSGDIDVVKGNVLMNSANAKTVKMNGDRPWRGPKELDEYFWGCLVLSCTSPGGIVVDLTAGTGTAFQSYDIVFPVLPDCSLP